jgi:hypothetical protein
MGVKESIPNIYSKNKFNQSHTPRNKIKQKFTNSYRVFSSPCELGTQETREKPFFLFLFLF